MNYTLIYCYDAYCGWCFGFSENMNRLCESFRDRISVEVLSGGMILPEKPVHINAMAAHIRASYPQIEQLTGAQFGRDYLWHVAPESDSDWYPDSLKPAVALCVFKDYYPGKQVMFAKQLEDALFKEGRDLCDDEAYRHLVIEHGLLPDEFYQKMHSDEYRDKAREEFSVVKQLNVTGYPCLFVQVSALKFVMIASGYTEYNLVTERLEKVMSESQS